MHTLTLIRHAKSSWENSQLPDLERPLGTRGLRDAPRIGGLLKNMKFSTDVCLLSPSRRTRKTLQLLGQDNPALLKVAQEDAKIYEADYTTLLALIKQQTQANLTIIGHNPGFTDLLNAISDSRIANLPTCGVAQVRFDMERWSDISQTRGILQLFVTPKSLSA
ncbi:histidine phosphatase family protein [Hahella sp. CR1]|uniref:SixA phosphatase family protein n=1 Tax=Hahella sp. CR1 TaxID=2992807 RepID=UPI002442FBD0|nr:histidine phosphatase family protein [Hahella sp. CR1]MDG9667393.1 histidine phosphatase family protein [Hahella sp. CR1]